MQAQLVRGLVIFHGISSFRFKLQTLYDPNLLSTPNMSAEACDWFNKNLTDWIAVLAPATLAP